VAADSFAQRLPGVDGVVDAAGTDEDEAVRESGGPLERFLA